MLLNTARIFASVKYALPVVIIIWCMFYVWQPETSYSDVLRPFKAEKPLFFDDFFAHDVDGDFDGSGIEALCANKTWTPNLMLSCDAPPGGLGPVKNSHLTCLRFAIEMGAELILPGIIKRHSTDVSVLIGYTGSGPPPTESPSYFWDVDHLHGTLGKHCPQMKVYRSVDEVWNVPSVLNWHTISLDDVDVERQDDVIKVSEMPHMSEKIRNLVDRISPPLERTRPVRFHLKTPTFVWPRAADSPSLARNWGRILRIRRDARVLAATALYNMQKRFGMRMDMRRGIQEGNFIGIHLRTEPDIEENFPAFDEQTAEYLDFLRKREASFVYLATGATQDNITAFRERARDFNMVVVTKADVLAGDSLRILLDDFTYDQRALVDYEIMLRADHVAAASGSAFAWNMALRRANAYGFNDFEDSQAAEGENKYYTRTQWQDPYSTILGPPDRAKLFKQTVWP